MTTGRLFEDPIDPDAPLAARMRPRTIDEVVGHTKLLGEGSKLRALIERKQIRSAILWGPAGTGKTTLAHIVAEAAGLPVEKLSAISSGVADVRKVIANARKHGRTLLFLDEIHRFNKAQQDAFLGAVEDGVLVLIGATTENPFFEVNSPLLSRSLVFRLEPLEPPEVAELLTRAMADTERGLGGRGLVLAPDALEYLSEKSGGDARMSLGALEVASELATARGESEITLQDAADALERRVVRYDKGGERHYDVISAFIKSMRGSDPDAALYWLAEMLEAGEDPRFICRRMVIFASEDIGQADPNALVVAVATAHALEHVGLPEAQLNMAQGVVYLATAPKSRAVTDALVRALKDVRARSHDVPKHLRDSQFAYQAMGDRPKWENEFRPPELAGKRYWQPDVDVPKHGRQD